jgi:hypothetical protein
MHACQAKHMDTRSACDKANGVQNQQLPTENAQKLKLGGLVGSWDSDEQTLA